MKKLIALLLRSHGTRETVCVLPDEKLPESLGAVRGRYAPELSLLVKSPARAEALARVAPFTAVMEAKAGRVSWYVCEGGVCALPVTEGGEA